ncbi:Sua5/YciO/YrdC/YwlC family protein [Aestuariibacter sp. AA17]|uniref:Threonylcarbamoyl-AMP synthase n=1 Tax=Fluctibacter corallii TaxID=2984329 RepID=A0ABT3AD29_9ALTE|nr:Sua5/YciO/YrdC/YwlC family protein [Aestuariibacter sp. AA17]MCV2886572.1 Sua5/YciO/YrdC/YwlC family protein [Aestuariibacter sp. AA17]
MTTEKDVSNPLVDAYENGKLIAYPTEAVFGLGCAPDNEEAVMSLLKLKNRPIEKGVILLASNYSQLLRYVDDAAIPMDMRTEIFSSWPGPNTWLLPASKQAPRWITGGSKLIAVRVTAHHDARQLCETLNGPIVSTSANVSGEEPARTWQEVTAVFGDSVYCVKGEVGTQQNPTQIRNGLTGEVIRAS